MYCKHCGFELQEKVNYFPACGKSQLDPVEREPIRPQPEPTPTAPAQPALNTYCLVGFSLSCVSFLLTFFGLTALAGLILSVIGLRQCSVKGERGRGFAFGGILLAVLSLITFALALATIVELITSGELAQLFPAGG